MPISSGTGPVRFLYAQISPVTTDPEKPMPGIEQHAVGPVDNTLGLRSIICHIRANDKNALLNVDEVICCLIR